MIIIYQTEQTGVSIVTPAPEYDLDFVAKKSVPNAVPYWIVNENELDYLDQQNRESWELDLVALGEPHGYGEQQ